jgi:UDP-N-acetylglucosamine 2-epimerase (non-hydrolysing)
MTEFDEPPEDSLDVEDDYDHDILLVAGSRPEVARLAPVARAFESVDRIRAVTIATGCDPMSVHEAYEALGVPVDVTVLLREPLGPNPATVAAVLMTRLDDLLVDLDPSAIMVHGGGMTAVVAAQVAFWRQIPVVHVQAGVATDDLLCPFPQEANRCVIGQLVCSACAHTPRRGFIDPELTGHITLELSNVDKASPADRPAAPRCGIGTPDEALDEQRT